MFDSKMSPPSSYTSRERQQLALAAATGNATTKIETLINLLGITRDQAAGINPDDCASLIAEYDTKRCSASSTDARSRIRQLTIRRDGVNSPFTHAQVARALASVKLVDSIDTS